MKASQVQSQNQQSSPYAVGQLSPAYCSLAQLVWSPQVAETWLSRASCPWFGHSMSFISWKKILSKLLAVGSNMMHNVRLLSLEAKGFALVGSHALPQNGRLEAVGSGSCIWWGHMGTLTGRTASHNTDLHLWTHTRIKTLASRWTSKSSNWM